MKFPYYIVQSILKVSQDFWARIKIYFGEIHGKNFAHVTYAWRAKIHLSKLYNTMSCKLSIYARF